MRPIPATRLGDAHGLLRAIDKRGRLRVDEFMTEFTITELFSPGLDNAMGRMRHFLSYARSAGLVKEDRGVVEDLVVAACADGKAKLEARRTQDMGFVQDLLNSFSGGRTG